MQIDMHHTGIYVLCRLAGMKSKYAKIVAYASQQVDDAKYGHALKFKNGGIFHQTMTAHVALSTTNLDVNAAIQVWIPFHFLPGGVGEFNPDGLITRPNSITSERLLKDLIQVGNGPLALYRLGIGLHVYADTFTHQDFKGFYDHYNLIKLQSAVEEKGYLDDLKFALLRRLGSILGPRLPIGHALVLANPDISYAHWSYQRQGQLIQVNNPEERFLPAVRQIYQFLCDYLQVNRQFRSTAEQKVFSAHEDKILELMTVHGSSTIRHTVWLEQIHHNYFEFPDFDLVDQNLGYHSREWFREAVVAKKVRNIFKAMEYKTYNYYMFEKKRDFATSHWVKFMRAAAEHKFLLIHDILPSLGIHLG